MKEQDKTQSKFDLETLEMSPKCMASGCETSQPVQRLDQGLDLSSADLSVLTGVLGTEARLFA